MAHGENPLPPEPAFLTSPPEPAPAPSGENPPWGIWDVVRIALVAALAIGVFSTIALGVATAQRGAGAASTAELARDPEVVIPAQLSAYLVVVAYMVWLMRVRGRAFWPAVRWQWPRPTWLAWLATGIVLALLVQASSALLPIPKSLPIEHYFRNATGAYMMAAFGVSFAPLVEELFFRGFLYPALARRLGVATGVAITAALFALIHASQLASAWAPLLLLFLVGVVLTAVRARTGSVGATFLIHAGYNGTLFTLLYFASDHFRHLEKIS